MSVPAGGSSLIDHGMPGQNMPAVGRFAALLLLVRVLTGLAAVAVAVLDARGHAAIVRHAADWSLPAPSIMVWLGTALLLVFGLGLVLGLASRICALGLLIVLLVIIATAGRVAGGLPLYGAALLAVGCVIIVARGGGRPQLLDRIDPRSW
ncbi:MAG: DoxX family membrane protein [Gaiellales bacterium]